MPNDIHFHYIEIQKFQHFWLRRILTFYKIICRGISFMSNTVDIYISITGLHQGKSCFPHGQLDTSKLKVQEIFSYFVPMTKTQNIIKREVQPWGFTLKSSQIKIKFILYSLCYYITYYILLSKNVFLLNIFHLSLFYSSLLC